VCQGASEKSKSKTQSKKVKHAGTSERRQEAPRGNPIRAGGESPAKIVAGQNAAAAKVSKVSGVKTR